MYLTATREPGHSENLRLELSDTVRLPLPPLGTNMPVKRKNTPQSTTRALTTYQEVSTLYALDPAGFQSPDELL